MTAIYGNNIEFSQPLYAAVPQGTAIDFVDPDLACDAGPGFCLNDFDYVDESALHVSADSGATKPVIMTQALAAGVPGTDYSTNIDFTGGLPPFTCSVTSGALPNGLHLVPATCRITGQMSDANRRLFTLTVTDSAGRTGSAQFAIRFRDRRTTVPITQ